MTKCSPFELTSKFTSVAVLLDSFVNSMRMPALVDGCSKPESGLELGDSCGDGDRRIGSHLLIVTGADVEGCASTTTFGRNRSTMASPKTNAEFSRSMGTAP